MVGSQTVVGWVMVGGGVVERPPAKTPKLVTKYKARPPSPTFTSFYSTFDSLFFSPSRPKHSTVEVIDGGLDHTGLRSSSWSSGMVIGYGMSAGPLPVIGTSPSLS